LHHSSATPADTSHLAVGLGHTIDVLRVRQKISQVDVGALGASGLGAE
jgi:hypothetical protein